MLFIHYEVSNTTYSTHHCNFTSFSFEHLLTVTVFESLVWGDVRLWGTGAKAVSFVPYTPVFQQLQFLNVLRKLAQTLFRGDSVSLWTGTHLENLDHEKSLLSPDKICVNSRAALNIQ